MTQWNSPSGDPTRQQPGYGQQPPPAYGQGRQQGFQQGYATPAPADTFGIAGTVMALLGGILVVVSFTAVNWRSDSNSGFGDIHDGLNSIGNRANGFASAYFGWLGWVFLVLVVVAGVLSSVPTPALRVTRIIGTVAGFAAAGLTFLAIDLVDGVTYTHYLKDARLGFYFAVAGFLLAGIGAAIGPNRV